MEHAGKLTKRAVEALEAKGASPTLLWDAELKGFGVKANPSGSKVFVVQYRNQERQQRRVEVGRFGVMTVEQARAGARIILGEVAKGIDPSAEKKAARDGVTVGQLCDWYLTEAKAGRILGRMRRPIRASSLTMDESRIESHIRPLLGRRKVASLRVTDIERMQVDIANGKTARPRGEGRGGVTKGGEGVAARSVATIHSIFNHALRDGQILSNPALGVRKFPDKKRTRRLSTNEIVDLGNLMREVEETEHPTGLAIIRVLLLSGMRLNEAQALKHSWVHDEGYVAYPETKTVEQIRIVGTPALKAIRARAPLEDNPYVFPSDGGQSHFIAADGVLGRLCHRLGWSDVTAHTLRHTYASIAGDLGYSELTIAAMLGHAAGSKTGRYVHLDEAVKSAAERVSREIASLLDSGKQDVTPSVSKFTLTAPLTTGGFGLAGPSSISVVQNSLIKPLPLGAEP
ncbi:Site-specific recombinase XerD [Sphingopyxis sp. YR583]|uniref:tyrosine-type recombinase/integrase n=1 Tax=Sphingopyxis sp. YR583 TaxID=1881047 RepID=UPI0008A7F3E9|nr:site-specific integrase [Sphingopyxis sp. YR583]SEH15098.1 Site-specific recombinase XerD [Sphingopyxis sp. YR583]